MQLLNRYNQTSSLFIPVLFAVVISFVFTFLIFLFTLNYGSPYDLKIELIACALLAGWIVLLVCARGEARKYKKGRLIAICFLFLVAAIYMANMVWNYGYLQADIYASMANGTMNADSLFHWTLAQGIENYGYPSRLIGVPSFANYHCFSHLLMSGISVISGVTIPFTYTYLYPIIFFPLYGFLILAVAQRLRSYFQINKPISLWDVFTLMAFLVGYLPYNWTEGMALWRGSWVLSESFFIANTIILIYLFCLLTAHRSGWFQKQWFRLVFLLLLNPLFIVIAYYSKVSLGVLLLTGIVFYFLRTRIKNIKYWLLNVYYILVFFAIWILLSMAKTEVKSINQVFDFSPFSFMQTYVPTQYWALHILLLFLFTIFVIYFRYRNETSLKGSIQSKKHIPEEILVVISVVGFFPGVVMKIAGGSAAYFSYVQMLGATLLLIGYNISYSVISAFSRNLCNKIMIAVFAFCIAYTFCFNATNGFEAFQNTFPWLLKERYSNSRAYTPEAKSEILTSWQDGKSINALSEILEIYFDKNKYIDDPFVRNMEEINRISKGDKNNFYIFADETAEVWTRYTQKNSACLYFYPANTGIIMIGALYEKDGEVYYGNHTKGFSNTWHSEKNSSRLDLPAALETTRRDGRRYLIYLSGSKMTVFDTQQTQNMTIYDE